MEFKEYYNELASDPNLFSKWFPAIQNCGFCIPKTRIIQVPVDVAQAFFMENRDLDNETIYNWVRESVMPEVTKLRAECNTHELFMKNGCFSDKFNAQNCFIGQDLFALTSKIISINYDAMIYDACGITELILRDRIPFNESATPCIYNGLPLRPELRVFYDFDSHKVLYSVNYWDFTYCHESISRNVTDAIIYEKVWPHLNNAYTTWHKKIEEAVDEKLKSVTELFGKWSVDILLDDDHNFWLIDMALAEQSAYWDPELCQ